MRVKFRVDHTVPQIYSVNKKEEEWFDTFKDLKKTGKYNDVIYLDCSCMGLKSLPKLPKYLEELICYKNKLKKLPKLPKTLKKINIYNNNIKKFPKQLDDIQVIGKSGQCLPDYSKCSCPINDNRINKFINTGITYRSTIDQYQDYSNYSDVIGDSIL